MINHNISVIVDLERKALTNQMQDVLQLCVEGNNLQYHKEFVALSMRVEILKQAMFEPQYFLTELFEQLRATTECQRSKRKSKAGFDAIRS